LDFRLSVAYFEFKGYNAFKLKAYNLEHKALRNQTFSKGVLRFRRGLEVLVACRSGQAPLKSPTQTNADNDVRYALAA
jgi:hypothetical protein